ncbi:MAG: hypothetical protein HGA85_04355, partial [Nanoarchaeota archaeon]|nr:hypothetical protein [Nanoarchaeota archaeon]
MALTGIDRIIGAPLDEDNLVAAALNLIAGGASNDDLETKLGINANSISKLLERKTGFNTYSQQTYYEHIIASEAKSKEELWNYLARTIKKMHDSGLKKEKIAENLGITGSQVNVIFSDVYGVGISFYKSRKSVINPLLHEKGRVSEDEVNTLVTNSALSLILNEGARAYTVEQKITLPKHIIDATLIETTGYAYQEIFLLRNLILAQEGKDADMVDSFWRIHKSGDYPDYTSIRYAFMSYVQERLVDGDSLADIGESVDIDRHILQQMIKTSFGTTARGSKSAKLAVSKNAEKPVDIDKALSSLYAGKTPERIAASYGVSKKVLGQFIKEKTGILMLDHQTYKLHIKKSRARNISAVKEYVAFQIKELVDEGLFENDISRRLHMTQQKIQDDFRDRFGAGLMFYRSRHPYAIAAFNEEGKIDAQAVDKRISDDVIPYLWTVSGGNFVKGNIEFKRLEEVLGVSKTVMSLALQQEYGFGLEDMGHYGKLILSGVLKSGDIPEDYVLSRSLAAAQSGVSLRSLMEEMGVSDHIIRNELKKRMGITYQQACRYGKMAREMPKRQKKEKNVRAKKANDEIYSPQLSEIILGTVQEVKKNLLAGMDKHRISEFLQMEYGMLLRLFIRETGYNLQDWQRFHYVIEKFGQHSLIDTEAFLLAGIKDMIGTGVKERRNITEEDICSTFQISASTRAALMSKTGFSFLEWRAYYGVINSGIGENIKEVETYIALKAKAAAKNRITKADFSSNLCVNENAVMKLVKRETGYNYADWFTYGDNLERFDSVNEVKDYLKKEIVRLGFANVPQEKAAEMLGITVTVLRTLLQDHTHRTYQELRNVRFGVDAETFLADHRPSWMMSSKELSRFSYHEGIAYLVETAKNCAIRGVEQEDLAKRLEIDNHIISRRLFEETGFTYQQWFTYKENLTGHKSIGEAKQAIIAKAKNAAISGEFIRDLSNEIGVSVANIMALIETTGFSYGQWGDYKEYLAKAGSTESASELIWVDIVKKARGKVKYVDLHKALGLTQTLTDRILAEHTTRSLYVL